MLNGTLTWPKDNSTTASCCSEVDPAGVINGPGDKFEVCPILLKCLTPVSDVVISKNVCSVQKDLMAGTSNAAVQFLTCCYFKKGMIGDCYE